MSKNQIKKMLNDCIEWAELTCDDDMNVGDFFDLLELRNQSSEYCLLVAKLYKEGVFK